MDVSILRRAGRHDEELARHLEMDRQDGRLGCGGSARSGLAIALRPEPDEELLAPPADALDRPPNHGRGEGLGLVAAQRPRPVGARTGDPRACHQAAEVAGYRLDFRQLGHA